MALRLVNSLRLTRTCLASQVRLMSNGGDGTYGSGAGKGGGSGGSIRDAGGSFGKREAAFEGEYFKRLEAEQLKKLRDLQSNMEDEVKYHQEQLKSHEEAEQLKALRQHHQEEVQELQKSVTMHEEAIKRHQDKIKKLKDMEGTTDSD